MSMRTLEDFQEFNGKLPFEYPMLVFGVRGCCLGGVAIMGIEGITCISPELGVT